MTTIPTSEEQELYDSLTEKQRRFVDEYLIDLNGKEAVVRAGYGTKHPNKLAYNMLHTPKVRAYLKYKTNLKIEKSPIKPEYVLKKIVKTVEEADRDGKGNIVLKGCELLARHLGMFVERQEISGPNGDPIKYEQVKEAADAFTSAINSLIERDGAGPTPFEIKSGDES